MDKFKGSLYRAVKLFLKSQGKIRSDGDENGNENLSLQVWRSKMSDLLCKVQDVFPHLYSCLSGQSRAGFLNL